MKKVFRIKAIIFTAIILFLAAGCKKEDPESFSMPATNLSITGATLNGTVNPGGLSTTVTFEYGTTTSYDSTITAIQSPVSGNNITNVSAEISGLTIGTTYHYRVKAENSHWTVYSNDNEFEYGYPPSATTLEVSNPTRTFTTLMGTVNARGLSTIVTVEYGTTTNYGSTVIASQSPVSGDSITNVSAEILDLIPCTTYHFRVKAENSFGVAYGSDLTFDTKQTATLTTTSVTDITATTAISGGNITDEGCSDITDRGVVCRRAQGILGRGILAAINKTHDGTGTGSFTSNLTGLKPGTTYYVRSFAANSAGTAYGNQISFTTPDSEK